MKLPGVGLSFEYPAPRSRPGLSLGPGSVSIRPRSRSGLGLDPGSVSIRARSRCHRRIGHRLDRRGLGLDPGSVSIRSPVSIRPRSRSGLGLDPGSVSIRPRSRSGHRSRSGPGLDPAPVSTRPRSRSGLGLDHRSRSSRSRCPEWLDLHGLARRELARLRGSMRCGLHVAIWTDFAASLGPRGLARRRDEFRVSFDVEGDGVSPATEEVQVPKLASRTPSQTRITSRGC